jgi:hypothetical protein
MSETTDNWRKAATAAVKDARRVAKKHLPVLRESTRAVIDSELPKVKKEIPRVARAVRDELPKVAEAIRREFQVRRKP